MKYYSPPPVPTSQPPGPRKSIYRRYYSATERLLLDATPTDDLTSEINLLRLLLTRVMEASRHRRDRTLESQAAILSAFSASGVVIASLVRLQVQLHKPVDEIKRQIEAGKNEGRRRMGVFNYFTPPAPA
jgi:hypothetical protein